jgi:hypothetical protein
VEADEIGIDLLAHAHECLYEGGAKLRAEQPRGLQECTKGKYLTRFQVFQAEPNQRGQTERLPHRLEKLRRQEVVADPVMGKLSGHEAGAAYQRKAERHDQSGVNKAKKRRHSRRGYELSNQQA